MILHGKPTANQRRGLLLLAAAVWMASTPGAPRADEPSPPSDDRETAESPPVAMLSGEAWRKTLGGLDEWFATQTTYGPKQIERLKQQLAGRVKKMSTDERDIFQRDLDAKLQMVQSPEGRDLLGWVAANLAAAAPAYRKKLDLQFPDILELTPAQLREQLDLLERRRSSAKSQLAGLEQARQARIAALQTEQRQLYEERERALDRGAASYGARGYRSPYHPGGMRQYPDVVTRSPYFLGFGFW
jgi:hypothetical protein